MANLKVDDLHPERKGISADFYKMQISRFESSKRILKAEFDISFETLKEIIGDKKPQWKAVEKVNGTWTDLGSVDNTRQENLS